MTNIFKELQEFDVQSRAILMGYKDPFLDFTDLNNQEYENLTDGVTDDTFQEVSNGIALSTPFKKDGVFYSEQRGIMKGHIPKL